jgi:hypothetical protein
MKNIYLGITTTTGSDWRSKIKEIDDLGIKEAEIFPTTLEPEQREEFYTHFEDFTIRHTPGQERFKQLLSSHGCTHMPAVRDRRYRAPTHGESFAVYECHTMRDMSEMDYLINHKRYLVSHNAIELNNSLKEQVKIKAHLEQLLL